MSFVALLRTTCFLAQPFFLAVALFSNGVMASCPIPPVNELIIRATDGDPAAQTWLGQGYETGGCFQGSPSSLPIDHEEAARWYRKAAENGSRLAQQKLGRMYIAGRGVAQNYQRALRLFEQGDAFVDLARMNIEGTGVPKSVPNALTLVRKAEQQEPAQRGAINDVLFEIATAYLEGMDVATDYGLSRKLFLAAAMHGHVKAQYQVGRMYMEGLGGQREIEAARHWFMQALNQGDNRAEHLLKELNTPN